MNTYELNKALASCQLPENWRDILLQCAEKICKESKISDATLGKKILSDANFFSNLRKGSGCRTDTFIKVVRCFGLYMRQRPEKLHSNRKGVLE